MYPMHLWRGSQATNSCCIRMSYYHRAVHIFVFFLSLFHFKSRDSSVGIALGYRLDDRGSRVRFPAGAGNYSLHHRVQNGSGAHPASYPMGTRRSFPGGKAAGAWSWPLTSIYCRGQRMSGVIPLLPNTPSWRGAQLKHRDNFTFTLPFPLLSVDPLECSVLWYRRWFR
jgi:hypothetical protein